MTNEEILEKYANERIFDHLQTSQEKIVMAKVLSAMDAAREDEAIEFAEWINTYTERMFGSYFGSRINSHSLLKSSQEYSVEELYQIFKSNP